MDQDEVKVSDLHLSAYLFAKGFRVRRVEGSPGRREFVFETIPPEVISSFYGGDDQVSAGPSSMLSETSGGSSPRGCDERDRSSPIRPSPEGAMNPTLELLLSRYYDGDLAPEHAADLEKSGLTVTTIQRQKIRSVPPAMIDRLLEFHAPQVVSAYIIPFPDPLGGWMDHIRLKVFPTFTDRRGSTVKYLGPRGAGPRLFFPLATMEAVFHGDRPTYLVEGAKKALAVAQLALPAVGFEGIEAWHRRGSGALLADFDFIPLPGRLIELLPDADISTNDNVERGARRLAEGLERSGARVRFVRLPLEVAA